MGNQHPTDNHWATSHERSRITCGRCKIFVEGLTNAADFACGTREKCFFFYEYSSADISTTVSAKGSEKGGEAGASVTIKAGTPMLKMFRMDGSDYQCTYCFAESEKHVFKSLALTIKGKAAIVNSDMTLNKATYGDV